MHKHPSSHQCWLTIVHPNFPQAIGSQMDCKLLDKILDEGMISLSGGDSDDEPLDNNLEEQMENHNSFHTTIAYPDKKPYYYR